MKTCIICNPLAGSVEAPDVLVQHLEQIDSAVVCLTSDPGEATRLARDAVRDGCELIVAAGGDGTLNEVLNGIADRLLDVRLGLIPLGTGNDFARLLDLPNSLDAAIGIIENGAVRLIDVVRVTSDKVRYFLNVSAGGFSGTVDEKLTPEIKKSWGPLAYLRCAAEALPELRAYSTEIVLDGTSTLNLELYNAIVANGRYVAGGTPVAPEALPDDGLLDIVLVPAAAARDIAFVAAQIALGQHLQNEKIVFRRAATVSVRSTPGMWFNVDGELVGNSPALFEVLPRALQFVAPTAKIL